MSRALRFAPLALLLLVIVALVWRLATPTDSNVPSKLEASRCPRSRSPPALAGQAGARARATCDGPARICSTSSPAGACRASAR